MTLHLIALVVFHPIRTTAALVLAVSACASAAIWAHVTDREPT